MKWEFCQIFSDDEDYDNNNDNDDKNNDSNNDNNNDYCTDYCSEKKVRCFVNILHCGMVLLSYLFCYRLLLNDIICHTDRLFNF